MTDIRAITVCQPWAWAIAWGGKRVENRSRPLAYRGPLLIHAGKRWSKRGASDMRIMDHPALLAMASAPDVCPRGALIATCELVDCHPAAGCCAPWGDDEYDGRPVHHLVLEDVKPLPEPIPCKGQLGLWRPSPEVWPS